jgi:hypothetical protein
MNKNGLYRPGAFLMAVSLVLFSSAAAGPVVLVIMTPSHEWLFNLNGLPALAMIMTSIVVVLLYLVGFIRYSSSKGYSNWLGFWLFLGNIPGFITLLLLPDLQQLRQERLVNHADMAQKT